MSLTWFLEKNSPWSSWELLSDFSHLISNLETIHGLGHLKDTFLSILFDIWPFHYFDDLQLFFHILFGPCLPGVYTHHFHEQLLSLCPPQQTAPDNAAWKLMLLLLVATRRPTNETKPTRPWCFIADTRWEERAKSWLGKGTPRKQTLKINKVVKWPNIKQNWQESIF